MTRLLRNQGSLPDWFPLPIYGKDLSPEEWLEELVVRFALALVLENTKDYSSVKASFTSIVVDHNRTGDSLLSKKESAGELWGVRELSAYELSYLSAMTVNSKKGKALFSEIESARSKHNISRLVVEKTALSKRWDGSFSSLIDWEAEPFKMPDVLPRFPVSIDLDQDDETLKLSLEVWLAGIREELGPAKRPFATKDFADWKEFGVLPIFDLDFWGTLTGCKYTDNVIANALWPDADVDTTERLRKVSRPKVKALFQDWYSIGRLWRQLELIAALNSLIQTKNAER